MSAVELLGVVFVILFWMIPFFGDRIPYIGGLIVTIWFIGFYITMGLTLFSILICTIILVVFAPPIGIPALLTFIIGGKKIGLF